MNEVQEAMLASGELDVAHTLGLTPYEKFMAERTEIRKRHRTPGAFGGRARRSARGPVIKQPRGRKTVQKRMFNLRIRQANFKRVLERKGRMVELFRMRESLKKFREENKL